MQGIAVGLEAKIHKPKLIKNMVRRTRLEEQLDRAQEKLFIFHGTMGYGKTVFLSSYGAREARSQSWYHINSLDNDVVTFAAYLAASVRRVWPEFEFDMEAGPLTKSEDRCQQMCQSFVNALLKAQSAREDGRLDMVLDDFQEITDDRVLLFLDCLTGNLPEGSRILIATKGRVPQLVYKYVLRGEARIFEAREMAFTRDEAGVLLENIFGEKAETENLDAVYGYSEGWPAGVMYLCLFIRQKRMSINKDNMDSVMRESRMHDFIMYELFRKLSFDIQKFLIRTGPLEFLDEGSCRAVSGVNNTTKILEYLIQEGMFIQKVDEQRDVYQYHSLFRSFLINQLSEEELTEIREKAAAYLLRNGQWEQAAVYAVESDNKKLIIQLIESAGMVLLSEGRSAIVNSWLRSTEGMEEHYPAKALAAAGVCSVLGGDRQRGMELLTAAIRKSLEQKEEKVFLLAVEETLRFLWENHRYKDAGVFLEWAKREYLEQFRGKNFPLRQQLVWNDLALGMDGKVGVLCRGLARENCEDPDIESLSEIFEASEQNGLDRLEQIENRFFEESERERKLKAFCGYKILSLKKQVPVEEEDHRRLAILEQVWPESVLLAYARIYMVLRLFRHGKKKEAAVWMQNSADLLGKIGVGDIQLTPQEIDIARCVLLIGADNLQDDDDGYHLVAFDFGEFRMIVAETGEELRWRTRKAQECMAYFLHIRGKKVSREELLSALWDVEHIPANEIAALHNMLSSIRKVLKPYGLEDLIQFQNGLYFLQKGMVYDERDMVDEICSSIDEGAADRIQARAHFLPGLLKCTYMRNLQGQWCEDARYVYENQFLKCLVVAGNSCFEQGMYEEACRYYTEAFQANPYDERLAVRGMECAAEGGEAGTVRRYYRDTVKRLREELGKEPDPVLEQAFTDCVSRCER